MREIFTDQFSTSSEEYVEDVQEEEEENGGKKHKFEIDVTKNLKKRHNLMLDEIKNEVNTQFRSLDLHIHSPSSLERLKKKREAKDRVIQMKADAM